jgi:uncharacterized protein
MPGITVIKRSTLGEETWRYSGKVLKRTGNAVILEALFNLDDIPFMDTELKRGDRFVELFYTDRWYNIFEIHDRDDDKLKGWYCNVSKPAVFELNDNLSFVDLALDLWVSCDGTQSVLDEDEFEALALDGYTRKKAIRALGELKTIFRNSHPVLLTADLI